MILWFLTLVFLFDASPYSYYRNTANTTEPALFSRQRGGLLRNLSRESAQSPSRFAAGRTSFNALSDIYGMTQCTRDISSGDCLACLDQAMGFIGNEIGARIYNPTCSLRFEVYAFYPAEGLMAPPPPPSAEQGNGSKSRRDIIIGVVVAILIIVILFICRVGRKKTVNGVLVESNSETIDESKPMLFDLNEIRAATDNFSKANELGQGGFGAVYKGTLADGQQIAVKRLLASSNQGIPELKNEVALLAKLKHRNLIKLLGCCLENQESLLIYEFAPNSSLEKFLFGSSPSPCTSVYNNSTYVPFNYLRSLMIQIQLNGVSLDGIFGSKSLKELLEVCYISTKILGSGSFTGT